MDDIIRGPKTTCVENTGAGEPSGGEMMVGRKPQQQGSGCSSLEKHEGRRAALGATESFAVWICGWCHTYEVPGCLPLQPRIMNQDRFAADRYKEPPAGMSFGADDGHAGGQEENLTERLAGSKTDSSSPLNNGRQSRKRQT